MKNLVERGASTENFQLERHEELKQLQSELDRLLKDMKEMDDSFRRKYGLTEYVKKED